MGVHVHGGTMPGALTPICEACGVSLCWDIGPDEYAEAKGFWDTWTCRDCNGGAALSLARWRTAREVGAGGTDRPAASGSARLSPIVTALVAAVAFTIPPMPRPAGHDRDLAWCRGCRPMPEALSAPRAPPPPWPRG